MPVILRYKGYRFFFYSNEGVPREPLHVHVRKGENLAKIWLEPDIAVCEAYGFSSRELNELIEVSQENLELFRKAWNEHFK